jgi:hypothetical protein
MSSDLRGLDDENVGLFLRRFRSHQVPVCLPATGPAAKGRPIGRVDSLDLPGIVAGVQHAHPCNLYDKHRRAEHVARIYTPELDARVLDMLHTESLGIRKLLH